MAVMSIARYRTEGKKTQHRILLFSWTFGSLISPSTHVQPQWSTIIRRTNMTLCLRIQNDIFIETFNRTHCVLGGNNYYLHLLSHIYAHTIRINSPKPPHKDLTTESVHIRRRSRTHARTNLRLVHRRPNRPSFLVSSSRSTKQQKKSRWDHNAGKINKKQQVKRSPN